MHTLVHDSVMALLPELLKGLQAASQASPGTQKAAEPNDDSSAPYGQSIRRPASMGERQYCAGQGAERGRLIPVSSVTSRDIPTGVLEAGMSEPDSFLHWLQPKGNRGQGRWPISEAPEVGSRSKKCGVEPLTVWAKGNTVLVKGQSVVG